MDLATQIEQMGRALTADELRKLLRMGRATIYEKTKGGRIPYFLLDGSIRYDCHKIAEWLRASTIPVAA